VKLIFLIGSLTAAPLSPPELCCPLHDFSQSRCIVAGTPRYGLRPQLLELLRYRGMHIRIGGLLRGWRLMAKALRILSELPRGVVARVGAGMIAGKSRINGAHDFLIVFVIPLAERRVLASDHGVCLINAQIHVSPPVTDLS